MGKFILSDMFTEIHCEILKQLSKSPRRDTWCDATKLKKLENPNHIKDYMSVIEEKYTLALQKACSKICYKKYNCKSFKMGCSFTWDNEGYKNNNIVSAKTYYDSNKGIYVVDTRKKWNEIIEYNSSLGIISKIIDRNNKIYIVVSDPLFTVYKNCNEKSFLSFFQNQIVPEYTDYELLFDDLLRNKIRNVLANIKTLDNTHPLDIEIFYEQHAESIKICIDIVSAQDGSLLSYIATIVKYKDIKQILNNITKDSDQYEALIEKLNNNLRVCQYTLETIWRKHLPVDSAKAITYSKLRAEILEYLLTDTKILDKMIESMAIYLIEKAKTIDVSYNIKDCIHSMFVDKYFFLEEIFAKMKYNHNNFNKTFNTLVDFHSTGL
jgi:hypothetical protein